MKFKIFTALAFALGLLFLTSRLGAQEVQIVQSHNISISSMDFLDSDTIAFTQTHWYFAENGTMNLGILHLPTGQAEYYPLPDQMTSPFSVIVDDLKKVWVLAAPVRYSYGPAHLYRFDPETKTFTNDFIINPDWWSGYAGSIDHDAYALAKGPDGRIWFNDGASDSRGHHIGYVNPATLELQIFQTPFLSYVRGGSIEIAVTSQGEVYYSHIISDEQSRFGLYRFDENGPSYSFIAYKSYTLEADNRGNLWFTAWDYANPHFGVVRPGGAVEYFDMPEAMCSGYSMQPREIVFDSRENLYLMTDRCFLRLKNGASEYEAFLMPGINSPAHLYIDSLNRLWIASQANYPGRPGLIQVAVAGDNQAPVANAGPDQSLIAIYADGSAMVTLDGGGSYDPDGDALEYLWTLGGVTLSTKVSEAIFLPLGEHRIVLTLSDGVEESSDEMIVTISATIEGLATLVDQQIQKGNIPAKTEKELLKVLERVEKFEAMQKNKIVIAQLEIFKQKVEIALKTDEISEETARLLTGAADALIGRF